MHFPQLLQPTISFCLSHVRCHYFCWFLSHLCHDIRPAELNLRRLQLLWQRSSSGFCICFDIGFLIKCSVIRQLKLMFSDDEAFIFCFNTGLLPSQLSVQTSIWTWRGLEKVCHLLQYELSSVSNPCKQLRSNIKKSCIALVFKSTCEKQSLLLYPFLRFTLLTFWFCPRGQHTQNYSTSLN